MYPYIEIQFRGVPRDTSLESAIHRWVARFEALNIRVRRALVTIEASGRRRTSVCLALALANSAAPTVSNSHADAYVAISEAFRAVRRRLLEPPSGGNAAPSLRVHRGRAVTP